MTIPDTLFSEIQQAVDRHQPELAVSRTGSLFVLEGLFVVSGPDGPFDFYQVQVRTTAGFPEEEPTVFEEGGRIPRIADRHVSPEGGNCCLGVWEEWLLTTPDHRFEAFLNGLMHDYFVSQTYFDVNGDWPFGEKSHGIPGLLESYADILGIAPDAEIIAHYLRLLSRPQIKGHVTCPCGSGKRLRKCHGNDLRGLASKIPNGVARQMLVKLKP